ncbi:origin recognition complex, subunit 4, partial [Lepidopterella palustris CBS 459.81]
ELKGPSRNNDRKSQTRSRRKGNFTDHIGNTDEPIIVESDPESSKDELASASGEDDESVEEIPEPNPFQPDQKERQKPATFNKLRILSGDPNADKELTALKKITLEKLIGKRPVPLIGLDSEHRKVYNMIENTVVAGEGNSMCIIGSRGSGKSALVNKALAELSKDYREDFHIVRLNGFIHTDDKLALRDIWKQLGKEMEWEDDSLSNSYSDTLATILALLRHPFEQTGIETEEVPKAIIFVMDEFDLFALHPRQTLLYNLFDIAQSRKAPIAVLGLTTKIEITNYLEKRVKSRFSHRYVHLSLAKSFTTFQEICKAGLLLQPDELNVEERAILSQPSTSVSQPRLNKSTKDTDVLTTWNTSVEALFADRTFLTAHLSPYYYLNKSVPAVLTSFLLPISLLTSSTFPFTPSTFLSLLPPSATLAPPDSKLTLLPHLSFLQLALLIAAARLDVILDAETCSFNMAYHEYVALAGKARMQSAAAGQMASGLASKVWGRAVARVEWERLVGWELCVPVAGVGSGTMVRVDVTLEEIVASVGPGMDRVLEKWCKQI